MPIIERPDYSKRRRIPGGLKLLLLVMVVLGIYLRSCWYEKKDQYFQIMEIELVDQTLGSIDVYFFVINNTRLSAEEPVLVRLYTDGGEEIASRISSIEIPPLSRRRYRKTIANWSRPLYEGEKLGYATVEIFKPRIF